MKEQTTTNLQKVKISVSIELIDRHKLVNFEIRGGSFRAYIVHCNQCDQTERHEF